MVIKRFFHDRLAQASYLVGCPAAGEAIIIDPNRDVDQYIEAAGKDGMRITAVTETHIHADYLSGSRELAAKTGAKLYLSGEGPEDWKYEFAKEDGAELICDGDTIRIGAVRLDVVKTPGHTPEHVSFVITDEASSSEPMGIFSGDFIFVGDVGRPDLLETAAGIQGSMESSARQLFHSIQSVLGLPPHLVVWPGHGAGSACGKALGAVPVSSLGYERLSNWALKAQSEDSFVREVLSGQPEPPRYFAEMKRLNKQGPPILGGFRTPRQTGADEVPRLVEGGTVVVDVRETEEFIAGHAPGSINVPMYKGFLTWAGSVIPYDRDLYLIASDEHQAATAARELAMIGLDRINGWIPASTLLQPLESMETTDSQHLPTEAVVIDVRNRSEWDGGHVPGAQHLPLATLTSRAGELPKDKPLVVYCQQGVRSPIAVSVLKSLGFQHVLNMEDGYDGYRTKNRPQIAAAT